MNLNDAQKISENIHYKNLVRKRTLYSWVMTFLILIVYFGFIYLVAFHKDILANKISSESVISLSIPLGFGVILFTVLLTGIYVRRANNEFDHLTAQIKGSIK